MENIVTKKDIEELVKTINNKRLENKNNWYVFISPLSLYDIQIKGYNTWLQVFKIKGIDYASTMGMNVKEYKEWLFNSLEQELRNE